MFIYGYGGGMVIGWGDRKESRVLEKMRLEGFLILDLCLLV